MTRTAREVLNELRWRNPGRLAEALLWYRDRTRPEGHRKIRGSEILELERRYFITTMARLPYYKIDRIDCAGETLFVRPPESQGKARGLSGREEIEIKKG